MGTFAIGGVVMPLRLRVGIIGLGRTWQSYRPVLHGLREVFDVRCVFDQRPHRAERVARHLGCSLAAGAVDLLERPEVEALLFLDAPWFGLWPVAQACRLSKPVFCAPSLVQDDAHADGLRQTVAATATPVLMGMSLVGSPALARLRDLLKRRLGPAQVVRYEATIPRHKATPTPAGGLRSPAALALFHECASIFDAAPCGVTTMTADATGFGSVLLDFGDGRVAQVSIWAGANVRRACRVQVVGVNGTVEAELPGDVRWRDREGRHVQRLAAHSARWRLLEQFFLVVRNGDKPRPDLASSHRALTWLRAAVRSLDEGKRVTVAE
jgi:predicted dehydrogenase